MSKTFDSLFYKEINYDDLSKKYKQEYIDITMLKQLMKKVINNNCDLFKNYIINQINSIDGLKIKKIGSDYIHITYYKRFLKNILKKDKNKKYYFDFAYLNSYILNFLDIVFLQLCEIVDDKNFREKYSKYIDVKYLSVFIQILKSVNDKNKPYMIISI
jgi:hypothetical protein